MIGSAAAELRWFDSAYERPETGQRILLRFEDGLCNVFYGRGFWNAGARDWCVTCAEHVCYGDPLNWAPLPPLPL